MAIGDLYRVVVNQIMEDTALQNRFYYVAQDSNDSATRLANAFQDLWFPAWKDVISDALAFTTIEVENVDSPGSQASITEGGTGSLSAATLPRFVNGVIQLIPTNNLVRMGRKAFAGMLETYNTGTEVSPTGLTALAVLRVLCESDVIHTSSTATWSPCLYSPANLSHPATDIITVVTGLVKGVMSTQNTRKT